MVEASKLEKKKPHPACIWTRGRWWRWQCECNGCEWQVEEERMGENGQRLLSLPVFSHSFFLNPPLTPVTLTLPAPPPPSRPNASRMWFFFFQFQRFYHNHHLPRIQSRARGGVFRSFDMSPATTTSLASKREPEVVFFDASPCLHPPPPPSRPNASRRWFFFNVFFYYGWDEGVVFIPHATPFDFFLFL